MKKHISKSIRRFWGIAELGEGFNMMPGQIYGTYFLTNIALVSPWMMGITTMLNSILGFVLTPVAGIMIDGTKPMKWGKLRSWLLVVPVIILICSPLAFIYYGSPNATAIIIFATSTISSTFYNTMVAANYSLISSMCAYPEEASELASNRMTGSNAGRMIAGYLVPTVMLVLLPMIGNLSYILIAILCSAFMLVTYLVHFKLAEGFEGNGQVGASANRRMNIKEMAQAVAAAPQIIVLVLADVNSTVNAFLLPGLLIYMYQYVIADGSVMGLMGIHNLSIGLLGTLGAFSARWFMKRIPDRRKVCYLVYPLIAASIFCSRFFVGSPVLFIAMCSLMQYFLAMTQPVEGTLYFDLAVIAQAKMGKDPTATFMALSNFAPRLSGVLRGIVMSALFISLNFDPTQPVTQALKDGFINAFSIISAIIPLVGWLALLIFYRITPERVEKARQEILDRDGALPAMDGE